MSEPYIGQVMMSGFNFAPKGWALCAGQLLSIAQNTALFSILGITYGGDGKVTFALPNLQGSAPIHYGQGPGLTPRDLGESSGTQSVMLLTSEMPTHTHNFMTFNNGGDMLQPAGNTLAAPNNGAAMYSNISNGAVMHPLEIGVAGGSMPHDNMQPYLAISYSIALEGIFPPRN